MAGTRKRVREGAANYRLDRVEEVAGVRSAGKVAITTTQTPTVRRPEADGCRARRRSTNLASGLVIRFNVLRCY